MTISGLGARWRGFGEAVGTKIGCSGGGEGSLEGGGRGDLGGFIGEAAGILGGDGGRTEEALGVRGICIGDCLGVPPPILGLTGVTGLLKNGPGAAKLSKGSASANGEATLDRPGVFVRCRGDFIGLSIWPPRAGCSKPILCFFREGRMDPATLADRTLTGGDATRCGGVLVSRSLRISESVGASE